jgi:hypothetical protein
METLTRDQDTKRIRQVKPGENIQTLYDELSGPDAEFWIKSSNTKETIRTSEDIAPGVSVYTYYNDTDAAEDAILFHTELLEGYSDDMPFVEIDNPLQRFEYTQTRMLDKAVRELENLPPEIEKALGYKPRLPSNDKPAPVPDLEPDGPGSDQFPYSVPPIWEQAHKTISATTWDSKRRNLLDRLGFAAAELKLTANDVNEMSETQEVMERDRSYGNSPPSVPMRTEL